MKVVGGIVGFVAFVALLMWGALRGAQAQSPAVMAPHNIGVQESAAVPRSAAALAEPRALPELVVLRDGKPLPLSGPRARPTLLHLWASWCGPCRAELPSLLAVGRKGAYEVVAVSVDDHFEGVTQFFAGKVPPEVAWDQKITLEPALGVESLPTTFVVDTRGVVRMRFDGMQRWEDPALLREIHDELARGGGT